MAHLSGPGERANKRPTQADASMQAPSRVSAVVHSISILLMITVFARRCKPSFDALLEKLRSQADILHIEQVESEAKKRKAAALDDSTK